MFENHTKTCNNFVRYSLQFHLMIIMINSAYSHWNVHVMYAFFRIFSILKLFRFIKIMNILFHHGIRCKSNLFIVTNFSRIVMLMKEEDFNWKINFHANNVSSRMIAKHNKCIYWIEFMYWFCFFLLFISFLSISYCIAGVVRSPHSTISILFSFRLP